MRGSQTVQQTKAQVWHHYQFLNKVPHTCLPQNASCKLFMIFNLAKIEDLSLKSQNKVVKISTWIDYV